METGTRAFPRGLCCDLTVRTGGAVAAASAEEEKRGRYAKQLTAHPEWGFAPFGVATDGALAPGAAARLAAWSQRLGAVRASGREPRGAPAPEVEAAAGRAFVRAMVAQAEAWLVEREWRVGAHRRAWGRVVPLRAPRGPVVGP